MGYEAGDKITIAEYNELFLDGNNLGSGYGINHLIGSGSLYHGLGEQTLNIVSTGQQITATQWNSLFTAMDNLANHTNDTLTSTEPRVSGDLIQIKQAIISDLQTLAASVEAGCPNATALATTAAQQTTQASGRWNESHIVEQSISFNSANEMRWFFNAGGKIQINVTRTGNAGSVASQKDMAMDDLIDSLGDFKIKSQSSEYSNDGSTNVNTLTTNGLSIGFYDLTTSYQTILELTQDWATYNSMYIKIEAKLNATPGSSTLLTVKTSLVDPDSGDSQFTAGNTSSVDQYENYIGVTNVVLKYVNPTTAEGLATVRTPFESAVVSNNIVTT